MGNVYGRMSAIHSMASSAISVRASPTKLKELTQAGRMAHSGRQQPLGGGRGPADSSRGGNHNDGDGNLGFGPHQHQLRRQPGNRSSIRQSASTVERIGPLRRSARIMSNSSLENHHSQSSIGLPGDQSMGSRASMMRVSGSHSQSKGNDDPLSVQSRLRRSARIARQGNSRAQRRFSHSRRNSGGHSSGRRHNSGRRH